MNPYVLSAALLISLGTLVGPVKAQTQRSGGSESQKILQQYQQLAAEKTSLQSQLAQMKKDLDSTKSELAAVKKDRDVLKGRSANAAVVAARLAQADASRQNVEKSLEQNKQKTTELVGRFKETLGTLKSVETDRAQLQRDNTALKAAFDKCAIDNTQLFDISNTVLTRYEHVGFFTKAGEAEPFTKLTRTKIDNLVDEYRQRAEELRVNKPAS